jgi:hypothetical protein
MKDAPNIFCWLDEVRKRPLMSACTIADLEWQVCGYYTALGIHNIQEGVPDMCDKFRTWLGVTTGWSVCSGWGYAFDKRTPPDQDVFKHFFTYVDRYWKLKPTIAARVTLRPEHQPTGKRCVIGHSGRMERPDEILVVNYAPTSLNHLRLRYADRYVDRHFLMLDDGSYDTQQADLFDWVSDEFKIDPSAWEIVA